MLAIGLFCVVMVYVCCLLDFDVWAKHTIQSLGVPQCGFFCSNTFCMFTINTLHVQCIYNFYICMFSTSLF